MFHSARLKLTAWYLLIIMVVSLSFSTVIYRMFSIEVDRFARIQRLRIQRGITNGLTPFTDDNTIPPRAVFDDALISEEEQRFILFLASINIGVLVIAGGLGYFLAGRTLKPISDMVDEQHRFISDASHELRTPLTALKSTLEVNLRDPKLTIATAKTLMKDSISDVDKLQSLSDALLELAQYQTPTNVLQCTTLQLSAVVDRAVRNVAGLAKQKHIAIDHKTPATSIEANEHSLTDLLTILLDNAIKYSPAHSDISVSAKQSDGTVLIAVRDHGIGIPEKDLPHIFDRFYRADTARSKQTVDGYGLGLSIAKRIAELHAGSITATSEPKKGSTFTIKLPVKQSRQTLS